MCYIHCVYPQMPEDPMYANARFYLAIVTDGLRTAIELAVIEEMDELACRLPTSAMMTVWMCVPSQCRAFRRDQGMVDVASPFLYITEENPFCQRMIKKRLIVKLDPLESPDDARRVLASITQQAHDGEFLRKARKGEIIRRLQRSLDIYSGPIRECVSLAGFG